MVSVSSFSTGTRRMLGKSGRVLRESKSPSSRSGVMPVLRQASQPPSAAMMKSSARGQRSRP